MKNPANLGTGLNSTRNHRSLFCCFVHNSSHQCTIGPNLEEPLGNISCFQFCHRRVRVLRGYEAFNRIKNLQITVNVQQTLQNILLREWTMLTNKQLYDIKQLQNEVEAHDALELKLNWNMLRTRDFAGHEFLYDENGNLTAFLGLYAFSSTVEVTGMVKPSERRQGHFTKLFHRAMATAKKEAYKKILLNAPASSAAAKAFLKKQGAVYQFSEHQMKWQKKALEASTGFTLREAMDADLAVRVRLDVEVFGVPQEDAAATESRIMGDQDTDMLMIDVDHDTIGKIRIKREDGEAWIYGFAIFPEHQGQGIGRNVLRHVVKQQSEAGHSVHLEVETKNAQALNLYESVGFVVVHAQDYYRYE